MTAHNKRKRSLSQLRKCVATGVVAAVVVLCFSCESRTGNTTPVVLGGDSVPTLLTTGVNTLISDSGIIRYRIIAEEWKIFENIATPCWTFEKGLFIERFDAAFKAEAYITCDTAFNYYDKGLWELRGRVLVRNLAGETFRTSLLFWDTRTQRIYSDRYMEIDGETRQLSGYDFSSNEQMTNYRIHSSAGRMPFHQAELSPQDSTTIDDNVKLGKDFDTSR